MSHCTDIINSLPFGSLSLNGPSSDTEPGPDCTTEDSEMRMASPCASSLSSTEDRQATQLSHSEFQHTQDHLCTSPDSATENPTEIFETVQQQEFASRQASTDMRSIYTRGMIAIHTSGHSTAVQERKGRLEKARKRSLFSWSGVRRPTTHRSVAGASLTDGSAKVGRKEQEHRRGPSTEKLSRALYRA